MTIVMIFTTVLLLVVLPLGLIGLLLLVTSGLAGPEKGETSNVPTVLNVGKDEVLRAIDGGDLEGTRRAFLAMTGACGFCSKFYRKRTAACGARRSQ